MPASCRLTGFGPGVAHTLMVVEPCRKGYLVTPSTGSLTGEVKMPARSSAVGTFVRRDTPRVIRVPS